MRILSVAIAVALVSGSSWSEPVAASAAGAEAGERVVCKLRQRTGTRFKTKICKTLAQWEEMAEQGRSGIKEMVDRPHVPICGPNGCDG